MLCEKCGKEYTGEFASGRFCSMRCLRTYHAVERSIQIAKLLLDGWENREIGKELGIAQRTVKAHFNKMFISHNITSGIKRVKLAVILYRKQLEEEHENGQHT